MLIILNNIYVKKGLKVVGIFFYSKRRPYRNVQIALIFMVRLSFHGGDTMSNSPKIGDFFILKNYSPHWIDTPVREIRGV